MIRAMGRGKLILADVERDATFRLDEGETVIQLHGVGPFNPFWVNPADVPDNKTGSN
jgi:hypothetical protein